MTFGSSSFGTTPLGVLSDDGLPPLTGVFAATEDADTLVAFANDGTGAAAVANFAATEAPDTAVATGSITNTPLGIVILRNVGAIYGNNVVWLDDIESTAAFASTEANDTMVALGNAVVSSTMSAVEGDDTLIALGDIYASGVFAATEDADTLSSSGDVYASGFVSAFEADDTLAASGSFVATGSLASSEDDDTLFAQASVVVGGSLASAEDDDAMFASGDIIVSGGMAAVEGDDTLVSTANAVLNASLASTEADDTLSATGVIGLVGSLTSTEEDDTLFSTGVVSAVGTIAVTDDDDTADISGYIYGSGSLAASEESDTLSAAGSISAVAIFNGTEDNDTLSASGVADVIGSAAIQEEDDVLVAVGLPVFVDSPELSARGVDAAIQLKWNLNPLVVPLQFEIFRSTTTFPQFHGDGDLIYTGLDYAFMDTDVVGDVRYFYTVFALTETTPEIKYTPFATKATAFASLRIVMKPTVVTEEYQPKRGEFGAAAAPIRFQRASKAWGDIEPGGIRRSDVLLLQPGAPTNVVAPVAGTISVVRGNIVTLTSTVGGFRFILRGLDASVTVGDEVRVGAIIGKLQDRSLEFEIFKLPVGTFGVRTVRPARFYLEIDVRDGRG